MQKTIYEVIEANVYDSNIAEAEDRARTIANNLGTELAGGMTCQLSNRDNYNVVKCPDDTMSTLSPKNEILDFIIEYEEGNLNDKQIIKGMQKLINNGLVYQLQGHYGRLANHLIENGLCKSNNAHNDK